MADNLYQAAPQVSLQLAHPHAALSGNISWVCRDDEVFITSLLHRGPRLRVAPTTAMSAAIRDYFVRYPEIDPYGSNEIAPGGFPRSDAHYPGNERYEDGEGNVELPVHLHIAKGRALPEGIVIFREPLLAPNATFRVRLASWQVAHYLDLSPLSAIGSRLSSLHANLPNQTLEVGRTTGPYLRVYGHQKSNGTLGWIEVGGAGWLDEGSFLEIDTRVTGVFQQASIFSAEYLSLRVAFRDYTRKPLVPVRYRAFLVQKREGIYQQRPTTYRSPELGAADMRVENNQFFFFQRPVSPFRVSSPAPPAIYDSVENRLRRISPEGLMAGNNVTIADSAQVRSRFSAPGPHFRLQATNKPNNYLVSGLLDPPAPVAADLVIFPLGAFNYRALPTTEGWEINTGDKIELDRGVLRITPEGQDKTFVYAPPQPDAYQLYRLQLCPVVAFDRDVLDSAHTLYDYARPDTVDTFANPPFVAQVPDPTRPGAENLVAYLHPQASNNNLDVGIEELVAQVATLSPVPLLEVTEGAVLDLAGGEAVEAGVSLVQPAAGLQPTSSEYPPFAFSAGLMPPLKWEAPGSFQVQGRYARLGDDSLATPTLTPNYEQEDRRVDPRSFDGYLLPWPYPNLLNFPARLTLRHFLPQDHLNATYQPWQTSQVGVGVSNPPLPVPLSYLTRNENILIARFAGLDLSTPQLEWEHYNLGILLAPDVSYLPPLPPSTEFHRLGMVTQVDRTTRRILIWVTLFNINPLNLIFTGQNPVPLTSATLSDLLGASQISNDQIALSMNELAAASLKRLLKKAPPTEEYTRLYLTSEGVILPDLDLTII